MEEYKSLALYPNTPIDEMKFYLISKMLNTTDGIESFRIDNKLININYNAYLLSKKFIQKLFNELGIIFKKERKKQGFFQSLIQNLIKENQQSFGNRKLDCCELNH